MKTGKIFWGVLFVAIGVLLLFERMDLFQVELGWMWKLWPLILVVWGAVILLGNKEPGKTVVVALLALGVALFVVGVFNFGWNWHPREWEANAAEYDQELSEPYDSTVHRGSFTFESGAGSFRLEDTTSRFFEASTHSTFGQYSLDTERIGDLEQVRLHMEGEHHGPWRGRLNHRASIKLNPLPVWDMRFDIGASSMDIDLSPYIVERLVVSAGAASVQLTLGDRAKETRVSIKSGVSALQMHVPDSAGCEIRIDGGLSRKNFRGFTKLDTGVYRTENFENAQKKIYIDLDAGVSSVSVRRYGV